MLRAQRKSARDMKTLTVMTPTYNRRELLKNAYRSLAGQTCDDFVWMIVDDGSTDGTEDEVKNFISEGIVDIIYIRKENGGKHTAINRAYEEVNTELIAVTLDSDDTFLPNAVEEILSAYNKTEKKYDGYVFLYKSIPAKIDSDLEVMSWQKAVSEGHFSGETVIVLKTEYAKKNPFPVYEGEKFCTEGLVWLRMTEPFYWDHIPICTGEYRSDGYSQNIIKFFAENPKSFMEYNKLRLSLWKGLSKRIKYAAYYDGFSMLAHEKGFIGNSPSKGLSLLALPAGVAFYLMLKMKRKQYCYL